MEDIGPSMDKAFQEAKAKLAAHQIPTQGEAVSVYHRVALRARTFDYTAGFAVPESTTVLDGLSDWALPRGKTLVVEHLGRYEHLGNAWSAAYQHARYKKLRQSKAGVFEIYRNDPHQTAARGLRTEIFLPLK